MGEVSVAEKWSAIDQLGGGLSGLWLTERELSKIGKSLELASITSTERAKYGKLLIESLFKLCWSHGDQLAPKVRVTLVRQEKNERGRHYRQKEYRLFMGNYSSYIIEFATTPDHLDIDPKQPLAIWHVHDDADLRSIKAEKPLKEAVKAYIGQHKPDATVAPAAQTASA